MTAAMWEDGRMKRKRFKWGKGGSTVDVGKKRPRWKLMPCMVKYMYCTVAHPDTIYLT
jgi:hypothetical protein